MQTVTTAARVADARHYFQIDPRQVDDECRVKEMRQFYFVARRAGLETKDGMAIRVALSVFFGRFIESRKSLSGGQWAEVTAAVSVGLLAW